jgi:single-strand DNA-binding protein
MPSLNKVFLMGNLTRDPELRYTPGGSAVCEMGLAINRRFAQANGEVKDETTFVDVVVWGKQAESAQRFLQKGAGAFVEGRLQYDTWVEKDTQKKRSRIRIVAERLQFLGRREDGSQGAAPQGAAAPGEGSQEPSYGQAPAQRPPQQRPAPQSRAPYQPQSQGFQQRPAPQGAPQGAPPAMPKEEPFEVVEGVDDDIPF